MNAEASVKLVISGADDRPCLTELFHRINSLIPDEQELKTISPSMTAADAIELMRERRFSQLPVVEGTEVLGIFSYRSFALEVIKMGKEKVLPGSLLVEDFIEKISFACVTDEFCEVFNSLDHDDAVLIGEPDRLQAIVVPMDVLRYLYGVASPYVLLGELELGIRGLMHWCQDDEQLSECAKTSLSSKYREKELPARLEDMTFDDYVWIIGDGRNWPKFETAFGSTRERTRGKLESIRDLRNDIFHFKRKVSVQDHEDLANYRDWLLRRIRMTEAKRGEA